MTLTIDTANKGLAMVLKDYQEKALRYLWSEEEGKSSREVWVEVNKALDGGRSISRASIINFLNAMVDDGVLDYVEITGKGGHRRIYSPGMNEDHFKRYIAKTVLGNLLRDFPEETKKVIETIHN